MIKKILCLLFFIGVNAMAEKKVYKKKLDNGLNIIVIDNGKIPIANVMVVYNVGCADDPEDLMGISHFVEHMMFSGTKTVPSHEFKKILQRHGGSPNAFTGWDYTVYHCSVKSEDVPKLLKMEADRMVNLVFSEAEIKSERDVVMQERLMRMENHPFGQLWEVALQAQNLYHPYGKPPIGYAHHINRYNFENTKKHYEKFYTASNATVIICGRIDPNETIKVVEEYFGNLPKKEIPERLRPQNPVIEGTQQRIIQHNKRNAQNILEFVYEAPHHKQNKKMALATVIVSHLLGGTKITDFYKNFVIKNKTALHISSSYDIFTFDPSKFAIEAIVRPDIDMKDFESSLFAYLKNNLQNKFSDEEVEMAKKHYLNDFAKMWDGNEHIAEFFLGLACGFSLEDLENYKKDIISLTTADINKTYETIFGKKPSVVLELYPDEKH